MSEYEALVKEEKAALERYHATAERTAWRAAVERSKAAASRYDAAKKEAERLGLEAAALEREASAAYHKAFLTPEFGAWVRALEATATYEGAP